MYDRPDQYYIPDNLSNRKKFLGIPNRNLIEAVAVEIVLLLILRILPFSIPVIVMAIIVMLGVGIFLVIGIHHESVTEFIITSFKFNSRKAKYHLRKVTEDEKITIEKESENEKVIGEDIIGDIKNKFFRDKVEEAEETTEPARNEEREE